MVVRNDHEFKCLMVVGKLLPWIAVLNTVNSRYLELSGNRKKSSRVRDNE